MRYSQILSYLSYEEATHMRILSKTWLQAWLTHPKLEFTFDFHKGNMKIVDKVMERYGETKIPIDKFELWMFSSKSRCGEVFPLIDKWIDIALQNGAKDLVYRDTSSTDPLYPLPIFTILAAKSLTKLVLTRCDLMHLSLPGGVVNCNSLRELSLLQTLLTSCPLIVNFIIEHCTELKKIELLTLQKIKSQFLESLKLDYASKGPERFNIGSQSLKDFKIKNCEGIEEIDAPNLLSFEYTEGQIPKLETAKKSSQLMHTKIVFYCWNNLDAAWFCKLRNFLSNWTSCSKVFLYFSEFNEINTKELKLHHRVSTPQVDVLDIASLRPSRECATFLDALLWSCHPKKLKLRSTAKMISYFIDRLTYMKNSSHSTSHESKSWHSQLKEVKAYTFDGENRRVELRSGDRAIRTLTESVTVCFLLDW
ncbi:putative F-box/FBD/LRR-repeat protein At5g44960 [Nicotiana tabacum]|uniref:F-box/FBD/LRR-repeat protein At5g44960 n=1 Tax=Nicotiana tabacum TaxID=4097 RepID=A0AC58SME5_TOBAC